MAISNLTITNEDLENKKISDIVGDSLTGTPSENKAKFDAYCEVIKTKFNLLVDELANAVSSTGVGAGDLSDTVKLVLENNAEYYLPKLNASNKINTAYIPDATTSTKGVVTLTNSITSGATNPPTSGAVYSAIQTIAGVGSNISDYVVGKGTATKGARGEAASPWAGIDWTYRKWDSGVAECWGTANYYVAHWEQWGGVYCGVADENNTYYAFDYPDNLFKNGSLPTVIASGGTTVGVTNSDIMCVGMSGTSSGMGTNTSTPKMYIIRPATGTSNATYAIFIYAIGVWK